MFAAVEPTSLDVRGLRDWVDDHWGAVSMTVCIAGALTLAVLLAVVFNVVATL